MSHKLLSCTTNLSVCTTVRVVAVCVVAVRVVALRVIAVRAIDVRVVAVCVVILPVEHNKLLVIYNFIN